MSLLPLFVAVSSIGVVPNDPRQALETAIAVIENQEARVASWSIEYQQQTKRVDGGSAATAGDLTYRELVDGSRFRISYEGSADDGRKAVKSQFERAFDGRQSRTLDQKRRAVLSGTPDTGVAITYFQRLYLFKDPLSETLQKIRGDGEVAWDQLDGRRLLCCRLSTPPHPMGRVIYSYWLDPEQSWQPRRVVEESNFEPTTYPDGRKQSIMMNSVREYIRDQGVTLPAQTECKREIVNRGGQRSVESRTWFKLTKLEITPTMDEASFTIPLPEGTQVVDVDRQVAYIEGEPGTERPLGSRGASQRVALAADGGRWFWWSDSRVWLTLAALLLVALGWMTWRQRRAQNA